MREVADQEKIARFMRFIGARARHEGRVYLTGGSTAVLQGWRNSTIDIDVRFIPELDELLRAIPEIKEKLQINIELASPPDFIPAVSGWEERSIFIVKEGRLEFYHFDLYSQALAKIERGHAQDISDVRMMIQKGLVERKQLLMFYESIESELYRYPAIDPPNFSRAVRSIVESESS